MSEMSSSEAIEKMKADAFSLGRVVCLACLVAGVSLSAYIWRFYSRSSLRLQDRAHALVLLAPACFMTAWVDPIEIFLDYHRVALPTWLTFGYPVAFGGVLPNVCDNVSWAIDPCGGGWPCISNCWKKWLVDMVVSDEWYWPCDPGPELALPPIIITLTGSYLVYIIWLLCTARKRAPKCEERDPLDLAIEKLRR